MPLNQKYISINSTSNDREERDLRADVGTFAYADQGSISAPFDIVELAIGSYRFEAANWNTIDHAPTNLPSSGHFLVWQANETTKVIYFVADETATANCLTSRAAEIVVIEGVAETWNYYASSDETYKFGEIAIPSSYDKGRATKLGHKTLHADYVRQYAYLNRGKRTGDINFNTSLAFGNTYIEFGSGSTFAPPTTQNVGVLRNDIAGCVVTQFWTPDNSNALFFRERTAAKTWGSWYTATEGNVLENDKVKVPTFYKRGVGSGYQSVPVYAAWKVDEIAKYTAGFGIAISPDRVVSWTGTQVPFSAVAPISYNGTTGQISWGGTTSNVPEGSNLYYTDARARAALSAGTGISYNSSTGVISSTITQYSDSLARAALSAGTGISYNNSTGVITSTITQYTETRARLAISATVPSTFVGGVIGWNGTTTNVAEGTNLYFTNARARAALSAGTGISYNSTTGVISSTITQYSDSLARAAFSAGTGISYNSTTGVISSTITQYTDAMARAAFSAGTDIAISAGGVISYVGCSATPSNHPTHKSDGSCGRNGSLRHRVSVLRDGAADYASCAIVANACASTQGCACHGICVLRDGIGNNTREGIITNTRTA